MRVAVIGGGINGIMSAWSLASIGHEVTLFEKGDLMSETSSKSTKLLHGGLRYLEHGELRLVREALRERIWWIEHAPQLARPIELVLPLYSWSPSPAWKLHVGLTIYDWLAGKRNLGLHQWHGREELLRVCPELKPDGLLGGFTFHDGQMDDRALGLWAAGMASAAGVNIHKHTPVERVSCEGTLQAGGEVQAYDAIVNVAGPWAKQLLDRSGVRTRYDLDLVRGSHILLNRQVSKGFLVEVQGEERICFVLPYAGKTLIGTTEVRQDISEPIICSDAEREYLMNVYNRGFFPAIRSADICGEFAGVRPLIRSKANPTRESREFAIERQGKLVSVFGGKWTTAHALGNQIAEVVGKIHAGPQHYWR